MIMFYRREWM